MNTHEKFESLAGISAVDAECALLRGVRRFGRVDWGRTRLLSERSLQGTYRLESRSAIPIRVDVSLRIGEDLSSGVLRIDDRIASSYSDKDFMRILSRLAADLADRVDG